MSNSPSNDDLSVASARFREDANEEEEEEDNKDERDNDGWGDDAEPEATQF